MILQTDIETLRAPTTAEVHLGHLRHNVRVLQQRAGAASLMGVIKADAYGHGAKEIARVLHQEGVRHLGVARLAEGIDLRAAGYALPILVFGAPLPDVLPAYVEHDLDITVPSRSIAEAVVATARRVGPLRVHVKVDTGMGRLGLTPDETPAVVRLLDQTPGITLAGLYAHFATVREHADAFAYTQLARFGQLWNTVGNAFEWAHLAHTGALLHMPESITSYDRVLARVGIGLYGLALPPGVAGLRPVMRLRSHMTQIKTVPPGTPISYGGTWTAPRTTRIATVGAGYGDGYPRLLSNRAEVGIGEHRYPVVGMVCMDLFMVDLGPPDGPGSAVDEGDEVVLFGEGGPTTFAVAEWAETIPYELCTGIAPRVPRRYVE